MQRGDLARVFYATGCPQGAPELARSIGRQFR